MEGVGFDFEDCSGEDDGNSARSEDGRLSVTNFFCFDFDGALVGTTEGALLGDPEADVAVAISASTTNMVQYAAGWNERRRDVVLLELEMD